MCILLKEFDSDPLSTTDGLLSESKEYPRALASRCGTEKTHRMKIAYLHIESPVAETKSAAGFRHEMQQRLWDVFRSPDWYVSAFPPEQTDEEIIELVESDLRDLLSRTDCPSLEDAGVTCLILDAISDEQPPAEEPQAPDHQGSD